MSNYKYHKVGLGGTFDRLHSGHKKLLDYAFSVSEFVSIGVTTNDFASEKQLSEIITSFNQRKNLLEQYLNNKGYSGRFSLVSISDVYGPTLTDTQIEALIVSKASIDGAKEVNRARADNNLKPLKIEIIDLFEDENHVTLSSSRVRAGVVNQEGYIYSKVFESSLKFSRELLLQLKAPMGDLVSEEKLTELLEKYNPVCTAVVGDASVETCIKQNIAFDYGVYDNKSKRKRTKHTHLPDYPIIESQNPAGQLTHQVIDDLRKLIHEPNGLLKIKGEEDLLVLALILLLPLESLIIYGQPNEGLVVVEVNEYTKDRWYRFLEQADKIAI